MGIVAIVLQFPSGLRLPTLKRTRLASLGVPSLPVSFHRLPPPKFPDPLAEKKASPPDGDPHMRNALFVRPSRGATQAPADGLASPPLAYLPLTPRLLRVSPLS